MYFKFNVMMLLTLLVVLNAGDRKNKRKNEEECSARRCCQTRKEFRNKDNIINCKLLSDRECGEHDEYCRWKCNPSQNDERDESFTTKYRGISTKEGSYESPKFDAEDFDKKRRKHVAGSAESYNEFVRDTQWLTVDECGVEYSVEMKPEKINQLYRNQESAKLSAGKRMNKLNQNEAAKLDDLMRRRMGVLGPDGRVETQSDVFPASAVLYLDFDDANGVPYRCTASMISDRWALTAGHCVYGNGGYSSNFKLYRDIHDCSDFASATYYKGGSIWLLSEFKETGDMKYDMAMIELETAPGLGYFGLGYDSAMTSEYMNMISHPADKDCDKMSQENALYDTFTDTTLSSKVIDTSGGASGSLVWDDKYTVYGVHADRYVGADGVHYNGGPRITAARYQTICNQAGLPGC